MKTIKKIIEVWFTIEPSKRRDFVTVETLSDALSACEFWASKFGYHSFCVDVTYYDDNHDIIENKSKWYKYFNGKLVRI